MITGLVYVTGVLTGAMIACYRLNRSKPIDEISGKTNLAGVHEFCLVTKPIVELIEKVGEKTDWQDGPETSRVFQWHEIEPLAKLLQSMEENRANNS